MTQGQSTSSGDVARIGQLEAALTAEREARARAEAADKAKSELLAAVSHEVRTPLGAIISMAELLLGTGLNSRQRHYADTLHQSGKALLTVLNEILDYSKLDAGRFEIESVPFNFVEQMDSVRSELEARISGKKLTSSLIYTEGFPKHLIGDPVRIRQVLNNLIDNALKFTEEGSVQIRAGYGHDGADVVIRFEVHDTGIGLSDEQISRLFEPYAQADNTVSAKYGGTGLGLSIARELARLMGGDLGCENKPGNGSMFWFTMRAQEAAQEPQPEAKPSPANQAPRPSKLGPLSGHVLIVEDNEVNQMLIAAYLDQFGLTYDMVANGAEAVSKVQEKTYAAVLMDIMMPVMDGVEASKQIRALDGPVAKIPIIALTANAMKGDREIYLSAGMDGYVSKPLSAASLFSALSEHLEIQMENAAEV